jgi:hypothetical protein
MLTAWGRFTQILTLASDQFYLVQITPGTLI